METFDLTSNCVGGYVSYYPYDYWQSTRDKGSEAYRVVKSLVSAKLVECKSATQFMALMDEIIKAL